MVEKTDNSSSLPKPPIDIWFEMHSGSQGYSNSFSDLFEGKHGLDSSFTTDDSSSIWWAFKNDLVALIKRKPRPNYIRQLVESKKGFWGKPLVLDLMGYGDVFRSLNLQGCAVALTDQRYTRSRKFDEENNNGFISGDVRNEETWKAISRWSQTTAGGQKFNLVLSRPSGGLLYVPKEEAFYCRTLKSIYRMLSHQDGYLFTEFHNSMVNTVQRASEQLKGVQGIETGYFGDRNNATFMFIKHPEAPKFLPQIKP